MVAFAQLRRQRREARVRGRARRLDLKLRKSRAGLSHDNMGAYQLVDVRTNCIIIGARFEASIEEIENWISSHL